MYTGGCETGIYDKNTHWAKEFVLQGGIGLQFTEAHLVVDLRSLTQGTAGGIQQDPVKGHGRKWRLQALWKDFKNKIVH